MSKCQKVCEAQERLIAFAIQWLAKWAGQKPGALLKSLPGDANRWLEPYRRLLYGDQTPVEPKPGSPLLSIFSQVCKDSAEPPQRYWKAGELTLELVAAVEEDEAHATDLAALWEGFTRELSQLFGLHKNEALRFEAFTHLLHRWAWAVPCSYGELGVSLYDEFRALSALVHASDCKEKPESEFSLVGGDIPGIQDFVYTITSKGAAKGLRGRSFFVQLLSDAVVRRLLADLELPEANVVYAAGGNFVLLAPPGAKTTETVSRVLKQVNARLAKAIQGDTALVVQTLQVSASDLFTPGPFKQKRDELAKRIARAKGQPLRELTGDWAALFKPKDKGSRLSCTVCRVEADEHNSRPLERTDEEPEATPAAEPPRICHLCYGLGELACDIRYENLWLVIKPVPHMLGTDFELTDDPLKLLARMTGLRYDFFSQPPEAHGTVLALNRPDFLQAHAHGFRLLANVTPTTTPADIQHLREEAKWAEKDLPQKDDIRSFTLLAHAAAASGAIERVGVLRMDVDDLGWVFSQGVTNLTLPKLSALSGMMERFFGGYLNTLVSKQADNDLYIIYAGGDDLFIVGAWHHLPDLAGAIHDTFRAFTGYNPVLSLSGGITLEGAKFPLYRAAERAGEAEGKAKSYTRPDGRAKDALCFLDTVVDWDDWGLVRAQKDELLWLVGARDNPEDERRLPRALLQVVQSIHRLYRIGLRDARRRVRAHNRGKPPDKKRPLPKPQLFFGRWVWMKVYSLTRLAERGKKDVPDAPARIEELQRQIMQPATVRYSGLAARWAEYVTRGSSAVEHRG